MQQQNGMRQTRPTSTDIPIITPVALSEVWNNQSSITEAQQSDQPELQITLQEVIGMIDSTAHEETMTDDVRLEETMTDDVRLEETMTDEMQQWFDWVV